MGWNTSALYLHGSTAEQAVASLAPAVPTGEWVGPDEATGGLRPDALFAADRDGWAEVWNPAMDLVPVYRPAGPATALAVMFSSVASTYGFTLHAGHAVRRQYVVSEGEVVADAGEPLPVEASVEVPSWGPDEDFLWAVIAAVTGIRYDETVRYRAYQLR